jgi:hypothetical protein
MADAMGDARSELEPGAFAGDYVVTGFIAQGGGGAVYDARHRATGQAAAVKVLHLSLTALPKMVERFRREVQVCNLLRHPSIVEVWEVGTLADGQPFYAMERLGGRTVQKMLVEEGRFSPGEAIEIFEPVCTALAAAHAAGVVHRDVKTGNIMVLDGGSRMVKLLDFGVAKLTAAAFGPSGLTSEGRQIGTPLSMAPEQILGGAVDARTDVYALGVLLYCMLTGRPPFLALTPLALMRQHLDEPAPRPSLRAPAAAALDPIVLRCMEKHPEYRYGSAGEVLAALRAATSSLPLRGESAPNTPELAAAIYVEMRVRPGAEETDENVDDVGGMLDAAEDALRDAGMLIISATGNQVLGVQLLPVEPAAAARDFQKLLDTAVDLRIRLDAHEQSNGRVHANVCAHADEVFVRISNKSVEVLGGPLVRTDLWAPREDVPGVHTTPAVRHLDAMKLRAYLAALVTVK